MPTDTAPTGRDLDAALATVMGWTHVVATASGVRGCNLPGIRQDVPKYSSSLDTLARDVEPEIRRRGLMLAYLKRLAGHPDCVDLQDEMNMADLEDMTTAPASVRAAAALAVLTGGSEMSLAVKLVLELLVLFAVPAAIAAAAVLVGTWLSEAEAGAPKGGE